MWTSTGSMFFNAVSLHVAFMIESKAADFTLKWLFQGMNSTMSIKMRGCSEYFEAIFASMYG
jgi:hypothetical protein